MADSLGKSAAHAYGKLLARCCHDRGRLDAPQPTDHF